LYYITYMTQLVDIQRW